MLQRFFNYFVCERIICGLLTEITEVDVVKGFDVQSVKMWERSFKDDLKDRLAMNAVTQNGISSVERNQTDVDNINFMFSNQIDTAEATDQERTGRCSLFLRA